MSRALSLNGTVSSEDNNTTWAFGLAGSRDSINPVNNVVVDEHKRTVSVLAGVTRVLTPNDIAQLTLTRTNGSGYYNDTFTGSVRALLMYELEPMEGRPFDDGRVGEFVREVFGDNPL